MEKQTIGLNFGHLLEALGPTERVRATTNAELREGGLLMNTGTLADATILAAPSSTRNRATAHDPDVRSRTAGSCPPPRRRQSTDTGRA